MSVDTVNQVYEVARIHDEYVVNYPFDGSGDTHGWVKATVSEFETEDETIKMAIDLPWGEVHRYGWSADNIINGPLSDVCKSYGYPVSEFERLVGEDIWLKLRYVSLEDGEIDTGTRMNYPCAASGPYTVTARMKVAIIGFLVSCLVFGLPVIL